MKKSTLAAAMLLSMGGMGAAQTAQADLTAGTILQFTAGTTLCYYWSGALCLAPDATATYFSMDNDGNGAEGGGEKTVFSPGPDGGIILGVTQDTNGHTSHSGPPHDGVGGIDDEWGFFGNAGMVFTTTAITDLTGSGATRTLDFSGWRVTWNTIPTINMGGDTANFPTDTGQATIVCSSAACAHGDTFTLTYVAHVPLGDVSGFGGVLYKINMVGSIDTTNVNNTPDAVDDTAQTTQDTPITYDVLGNDTDEGAAVVAADVTVAIVSGSESNATCTVNASNQVTLTPATGYASSGGDRATCNYTLTDAGGLSDTATLSVEVLATGSNVAPVAVNDDGGTTVLGTPKSVDVLANDTDEGVAVVPADVTLAIVSGSASNASCAVVSQEVVVTPTRAATASCRYTITDAGSLASNEATVTVTVNTTQPASNSGTLSPGATATAAGGTPASTGGGLTTADVGTDSALSQQCVGGCFDFSVSGLSAGGTVKVVLPLTAAIPSDAVYRKYVGTAWQGFTSDGVDNKVESAAGSGTDGSAATCPPPGSSSYSSGLTAGNRCVQLTIKDGGANDADSLSNGTVLDPSGVGVPVANVIDTSYSKTTSGCSLTGGRINPTERGDWWIVAGFLAWLGALRMRFRRQTQP